MTKISNKRVRLLATVGGAMAATMIVTAAHAAQTVVGPINPLTPSTTTVSNGENVPFNEDSTHDGVAANQANASGILAQVLNTLNGVGVGDVDDTTQTTITVESNEVAASAAGNIFANSIDLTVIENDDEDGDGAAAVGASVNVGPISSVAQANHIRSDAEDFESGSVSVSNNSITADASGNRGTTSLAGSIPNGYSSELSGYSVLDSSGAPTDALSAGGSLVASTVQVNAGAVSSNVTPYDGDELEVAPGYSNNQISLDLVSNDSLTFTAAPTVEGNLIGATAKGNASNSTIDIQLDPGSGGAAPTFAGSAVVTNGQANAGGISALNDSSTISGTVSAADAEEGEYNALAGSLSVDGNTISAGASGNEALGTSGQAGNRILLADGLSFQGQGEGSAEVDAGYDSGDASSSAYADLIINNSQGNSLPAVDDERLAVSARVENSMISGSVDALGEYVLNGEAGGAVSVSDNASTATARGNAASSAIASGENSAAFSGSVAVANQQINYNTNVSAINALGQITADVDGDQDALLQGSTVAVDGNTQSAAAYGNQVSQSVALAATVVDLPASGVSLTGGTGSPEGNVSADGGAIVSSLQTLYDSSVVADLDNAWTGVDIYADDLAGSTISLDGNTQEAVAVGSSGSNALSVSSTGLSGGAGIVSVQIADNNVDISANTAVETSAYVNEVSGASINLTDNLARSVAYGGSVSNTLNVNTTTVAIDGNGDTASIVTLDPEENFVLDNDEQPSVQAAYGLLNIQSTSASVSAELAAYDDADESAEVFLVDVAGSVDSGSSVANEDNTAVAAAYGNQAVNSGGRLPDGTLVPMMAAGTISSDGEFAAVLNVTNAQTLTTDSTVLASAAGDVMVTAVSQDVIASSVSTSGNAVQAQAYGNLVTNEAVVAATNIDNGSSTSTGVSLVQVLPWDDIEASVDGSFTLNNVQAADGSITATLLDDALEPSLATTILTVIGADATGTQGDVRESSVLSNENMLSASATGNGANNLLAISANNLSTTGALLNSQTSNADLAARIGIAGTEGTPFIAGTDPTPFTFDYELVLSGNCSDGTCTGVSGIDRVAVADLTVDEQTALTGAGWTLNGLYLQRPTTQTVAATLPAADFVELGGSIYDGAGAFGGTSDIAATLGTPNEGGVVIAVRDDVVGSTIAVNSNTIAGSVTGNSANNTLAIDATSAVHANNQISTLVELRDGGSAANGEVSEVIADYSLNNVQQIGGSDISSEVYGTLAIDLDYSPFTTFETSTLSVDDNVQSSRAVANTAVNTVDFSATNSTAGSALASNQFGAAGVEAVSDLDIYVPVSGASSSVSVANNTNLALAVSNDVQNELNASGTNLNPVGAERDVRLLSNDNVRAGGDHILANQQVTFNNVTSTAATTIWNDDYLDGEAEALEADGIRNSSIAVTGNLTIAEATANRATNTADVSAGAALTASAGVANYQATSGEMEVSATASTNASVALGSAADPLFNPAVDGSSVTLGQNTTSSLARGNAATNVLNYSAGSNYGGTTIGSDPYTTLSHTGDSTVRARAGVLNAQVNNAAVSAESVNTSYVVALNSSEAPVVTNATIGVIGNAVSAAAYGNTATNRLTVASLNSNAPSAAIGNVQYNSGPVSASVTTVTYGVTSGVGSIAGSSLGVTGNAITATAVGNSAVSSITGQ